MEPHHIVTTTPFSDSGLSGDWKIRARPCSPPQLEVREAAACNRQKRCGSQREVGMEDAGE